MEGSAQLIIGNVVLDVGVLLRGNPVRILAKDVGEGS